MIVKSEKNIFGLYDHTFYFEEFKELFRLKVTGEINNYSTWQNCNLRRFWYFKYKYYKPNNTYIYYAKPLYPFVYLFGWLNKLWWSLGLYCKNKSWLKLEEGVKPTWFWPIYLVKQMTKPKVMDIEKLRVELNKK